MTEDLIKSIRAKQTILFVGAGLSALVGAPTWSGLMEWLATELGFDPEVFCPPDANYLTLAEYYKVKNGSIKPLTTWMKEEWPANPDEIKRSRAHMAITKLAFPIIYTTNYDGNLELAHDVMGQSYKQIVRVQDLVGCGASTTQIVKFHGDLSSDSSIVLTETDYFGRLSFESPLDIKFRSDVLSKSILFIGYSLSDINIRLLLHKLAQAWRSSGSTEVRPSSYIFLPQPDEVQSTVLGEWGVNVIAGEDDDPRKSLENFLEKLDRDVSERG